MGTIYHMECDIRLVNFAFLCMLTEAIFLSCFALIKRKHMELFFKQLQMLFLLISNDCTSIGSGDKLALAVFTVISGGI